MVNFIPDRLSVIIRYHACNVGSAQLMQRCLFSLATSTYRQIEVVIVTHNFGETELAQVNKLHGELGWSAESSLQVENLAFPPGIDSRSALLNHGMEVATGQYLAFLDYDDYVYEHAYESLIQQLRQSTHVACMGGCVAAISPLPEAPLFVGSKRALWASRKPEDFLKHNIFPIHTFVIDRIRLGNPLPEFDTGLTRLEDYDFLLKLRRLTDFDLTLFKTVLFEYSMRMDGTNSSLWQSKFCPEWKECGAKVEQTRLATLAALGLGT